MDPVEKAFIVYIAFLDLDLKILIYQAREDQITLLIVKKMAILAEYLGYINVFSKDSDAELPKDSDINEHAIKLEPGKQSPYKPIYSLGLVKLKTFKTYIETNLANGFICPSKSTAGAPILFI